MTQPELSEQASCTLCWTDFITGTTTDHAHVAALVTYDGEDPSLYGPNDEPTVSIAPEAEAAYNAASDAGATQSVAEYAAVVASGARLINLVVVIRERVGAVSPQDVSAIADVLGLPVNDDEASQIANLAQRIVSNRR